MWTQALCLEQRRSVLIPAELVRKGQCILALTNPDPEITPEAALAAGASFAADGAFAFGEATTSLPAAGAVN